MVGALIRQLRMERNYSQAGLAHGICAASYLSKIEQGQVEPGAEILDRLFAALGVEYCRDAGLLAEAEAQLAAYYEAREREEAVDVPGRWLDTHAGQLLYSDLCLPVQVWRIYRALDRQEREEALVLRDRLAGQLDPMTAETQYRYLVACEQLTKDEWEALALLQKAERRKPCALAQLAVAQMLYHLGQYSRCIEKTERAYAAAAEEGDLYVLVWASFLLGSCYTSRDLNFAEKYYRRSIRLGKLLEPRVVDWAAYNLGASYLEWGQLDNALYWLSRTNPVSGKTGRHNLLLYQKRSLLFAQLGRLAEAEAAYRDALQELEDRFPGLDSWEREVYTDMVRFAGFQLEQVQGEDYEAVLRRIYHQAGEQLGFGFRRFYGMYLVKLYRSQRRYKEALQITEELQEQFS